MPLAQKACQQGRHLVSASRGHLVLKQRGGWFGGSASFPSLAKCQYKALLPSLKYLLFITQWYCQPHTLSTAQTPRHGLSPNSSNSEGEPEPGAAVTYIMATHLHYSSIWAALPSASHLLTGVNNCSPSFPIC